VILGPAKVLSIRRGITVDMPWLAEQAFSRQVPTALSRFARIGLGLRNEPALVIFLVADEPIAWTEGFIIAPKK